MPPTDAPNAGPVAAVLVAHGAFLAACVCYGSASTGWAPSAMHSAYAGLGSSGALGACALLSVSGSRPLYMVGVHVALLLQAALTGVFGWQAWKSYGIPEKADRFPLFVVMCAGSILALGAMRAFKPKKNKKGD